MAVLSYNEIVGKTVIKYNGEPYEVLSSHVFRMQANAPQNKTKLRHLISGRVVEVSFHQSDTAEEADIDTMGARYLYTNRPGPWPLVGQAGRRAGGESWFAQEGNPKNRFSFPENAVHDKVQWLSQNALVEVVTYEEKPITIKIPIKVDLEVKEAPPTIKGNTASGGTKIVVLSTGATVDAPLFINAGDVLRINTGTGEYAERVEKA